VDARNWAVLGPSETAAQVGLPCLFMASSRGDSPASLRPARPFKSQNPKLKTRPQEPALKRGPKGPQNKEGVSDDLDRGGEGNARWSTKRTSSSIA
jgi:hypothetical protein